MYEFSMDENEPLRISLSYAEAISKMQSMFGEKWSKETLDFLLQHFQGHIENTIKAILDYGIQNQDNVLKAISTGSTTEADEDDFMVRPKALSNTAILPNDYLRIPGYELPFSVAGIDEQCDPTSTGRTQKVESVAGNLAITGSKMMGTVAGKQVQYLFADLRF